MGAGGKDLVQRVVQRCSLIGTARPGEVVCKERERAREGERGRERAREGERERERERERGVEIDRWWVANICMLICCPFNHTY